MQTIQCTKCGKTVTTNAVVKYTSTLGTRKTVMPEKCWTSAKCKEQPTEEKK